MLKLLLTGIIFFILDLLWIGLYFRFPFGRIVRDIQNEQLVFNPIGAIIAYVLLTVGVYYFGVRNNSVINGGLFGLLVYGIFDATNYAIFKDYKADIAIIDTIWGFSVSMMTTYLVYRLTKK